MIPAHGLHDPSVSEDVAFISNRCVINVTVSIWLDPPKPFIKSKLKTRKPKSSKKAKES